MFYVQKHHRKLTYLVVFVCLPPGALGQALFSGLGDLAPNTPPYGYINSQAYGVSGDGLVVVGRGSSWSGFEAFRLEGGIMEGLGDLPYGDFDSRALAASTDGSVVVGRGDSPAVIGGSYTAAFAWTDGLMYELPNPQGFPPGSYSTSAAAADVSADGTVIVGHGGPSSARKAVIWDNGSALDLGGTDSRANAVSSDGTIVVGTLKNASGNDEGFRWEGGIFTMLGDLAGGPFQSEATAISADGNVIVGWSSATLGIEAFRWENGAMTGLGDFPGNDHNSKALAVSGDGSVIVGTSVDLIAFVWDATHGMRELKSVLETDFGLDLTGWELGKATGISDDGLTVVGNGFNLTNVQEAWLARVPSWEPDCNSNGTPDFEEIAMGTAFDCNMNLIIDDCDLASGQSLDTNNDTIPDDCQSCDLGCDDLVMCTADSCVGGLCEHTPLVNGDVYPCGGDGLIDVDDIVTVLAAFQGLFVCGCGPQP